MGEASSDEARLTAEDRLDIMQIMAEYATYEDTGQSEAWANLFTSDGSFQSRDNEPVVGHEALLRFSRNLWSNAERRRLRHVVSNVVITPSADGADVHSYQLTIAKSDDGYVLREVSGKSDKVRKESGRWRFFSRRVVDVGG